MLSKWFIFSVLCFTFSAFALPVAEEGPGIPPIIIERAEGPGIPPIIIERAEDWPVHVAYGEGPVRECPDEVEGLGKRKDIWLPDPTIYIYEADKRCRDTVGPGTLPVHVAVGTGVVIEQAGEEEGPGIPPMIIKTAEGFYFVCPEGGEESVCINSLLSAVGDNEKGPTVLINQEGVPLVDWDWAVHYMPVVPKTGVERADMLAGL